MPDNPSKNTTGEPRQPPEDIERKQDAGHSEDDFLRDLDRASRRVTEPDPPRASERGRGSPRR
jgi:hypothetical protein